MRSRKGKCPVPNDLLRVIAADSRDGVPMYERMDSAHGIAPDPEMVESVNVLVGHVPPEFGFKSGGVIEVRTATGKSERRSGGR